MTSRSLFTLPILAAVLVGCVTAGNRFVDLPSEQADSSYRRLALRWIGTYQGTETSVYLKSSNDGGRLKLCGYFIRSDSFSSDQLAQLWLDQGFVMSGDAELVSAMFIRAKVPRYNNTDTTAACVRVDLPWDAARHDVGRLGLKGGQVTIRG